MRESTKSGALTESTFYILLSLYKPNHGYAIMQFIEKQTEGRMSMGPGTLYGAIQQLLKKGWIVPINRHENPRKKEYVITELGKEHVDSEISRLGELFMLARKIVKES